MKRNDVVNYFILRDYFMDKQREIDKKIRESIYLFFYEKNKVLPYLCLRQLFR